jgi:hypothetical protein
VLNGIESIGPRRATPSSPSATPARARGARQSSSRRREADARGRAVEGHAPSSVNDAMESSPLGTGDFAVNAGFAALTLDPNDAKALASPLTPAERRSVVAALTHRDDRRYSLDGGDEGAGADASPAFSPAVAAVVAKAVAGKILTLEEKGALQSAMEAQEKRRRARARRAELENADPGGGFAFQVTVSPYDPKTPTSGFGSLRAGSSAGRAAEIASAASRSQSGSADSFRYPAMTDDNTPSTGRMVSPKLLDNILTPLTNASSVPSLPSNSSLKHDVEQNRMRRAMAAAARGDFLTPESAAAVAAVDALRDGKLVSLHRLEALERMGGIHSEHDGVSVRPCATSDEKKSFQRDEKEERGEGGFGSPVGNPSTPAFERRDAMNVIYAKSAAGVKLSDEEEEVLRRYLMATPPAVPSAVARRHKQRIIGGKTLSP